MLRLLFSCLLCFYISKAKVRLVVICSMFSLVFEVLPMVLYLLALMQTIRILLTPGKTLKEQLLLSISALRVLWHSVMCSVTRSGFDLISLITAWGIRAENCLEATLPSFVFPGSFKILLLFLGVFLLIGHPFLPHLKGTAMFGAVFVENLMLTSSNIFKRLSLKPLCHHWTFWQADCFLQSRRVESDFMFWLICRSFRAKGITGRRQKSCVKNMGFTTCLFFFLLSVFWVFLAYLEKLVFLPL